MITFRCHLDEDGFPFVSGAFQGFFFFIISVRFSSPPSTLTCSAFFHLFSFQSASINCLPLEFCVRVCAFSISSFLSARCISRSSSQHHTKAQTLSFLSSKFIQHRLVECLLKISCTPQKPLKSHFRQYIFVPL